MTADARRRWTGAIFLAVAVLMLFIGLTVLRDRMSPRVFLIYWLTCMVFTGLTMIVALLDMRVVRRRSMKEKQELAKTVLREFIDDESESSPK